ncbi:AprA-related methyltransferase [Facilibium subflavum]|uniref:AprA-related methyltransferase n=1 Tax=Facilibium subflavum TaxID=2219058 RepID=UPI000E647AD9|nr:hypothetical protein [Facilibium subflavum]
MQHTVTSINQKACAAKIRSIKHQLEIGAVLDNLGQQGVIEYLCTARQRDLQTLCATLNLPEGYLGISFKCLWMNGFFDNKASLNHLSLSQYGRDYLQKGDLYQGMQQSIQEALKQYHRLITDTLNTQHFLTSQQYQQSAPFVLIGLFMLSKIPKEALSVQLQSDKALWQWLIKQLLPDSDFNTLQKEDFQILQFLAPIAFHTLSYLPSYADILAVLQYHTKPVTPKNNEAEYIDRTLDIATSASLFQSSIADIFFHHLKPLFDHPLFLMQPKSIMDLGCGNGEMLEKVYYFIAQHTLRGKVLKDYPLYLIGVDCNLIPIRLAENRLSRLDTPYTVINEDINTPQKIWEKLYFKGLVPDNCLHISKSVIHNCKYHHPSNINSAFPAKNQSFHIYTDDTLNLRTSQQIKEHLQEHFKCWQSYISEYGYLFIEAHNGIDKDFNPQSLSETDRSNLTTLNLSHDLSLQYLVDTTTFHQALKEAGFDLAAFTPLQKASNNTCLALYYIKHPISEKINV